MDDDMEAQVIEKNEDVEEEEVEGEDIYHSPKTLFRLALWANILAWVVPIIEIGVFIFSIYANLYLGRAQLGSVPRYQLVGYVLNLLSPLLIGIAWFVVLKAVSEVIYLLVDIYEKK
jgi:hypothetical protein